MNGTSHEYEFSFLISSIQRLLSDKPAEWLSEWYVNGPVFPFCFTRLTNRELEFFYKKDRKVYENFNAKPRTNDNIFNDIPKKINSVDYSFIKFKYENKDYSFIIHSVKDSFNPKWSKKLGIEYRNQWGVPDQIMREKISEIISFSLGRQIIKIGETKFDKYGFTIEENLFTPRINPEINLKNLTKIPDIYPVKFRINSKNSSTNIESLLKFLIPSYLIQRDKLNLNEVFWIYWMSQSLPSYSKLVMVAGAFEQLANNWFDSSKSKSKGKLLPPKEYEKLFKKDLDSIKYKIRKLKSNSEDYENIEKLKARLYQKIAELNELGSNARIYSFLSEIKLSIGNIEKNAIKCRNKPAHGTILDKEKFGKLIKYELAYRTLFNRAILKILDYKGDYIDHYNAKSVIRRIYDPVRD